MQKIFYFQYIYDRLINMKNALKKPRVWIIAAALSIVGAATPFIVLVITLNLPKASTFQYPLMLGVFSAVYLLVGFVWGDLHIVSYRRKNKNWDGALPEEIKTSAWSRRWPFYAAAITTFVVLLVFEIIFWATGSYPFL